jgi:tRNA(Ile2) C34 agmatinyltransferase TiaS
MSAQLAPPVFGLRRKKGPGGGIRTMTGEGKENAMLIEELEELSLEVGLYREEATCPICGEQRGFGTQADWTRCRICRTPLELDAGQGDVPHV